MALLPLKEAGSLLCLCVVSTLLAFTDANVPFLGAASIFGGHNNNNNNHGPTKLPPPPPPKNSRKGFTSARGGNRPRNFAAPPEAVVQPNRTKTSPQQQNGYTKPPPPPPKVTMTLPGNVQIHQQGEFPRPPWPPEQQQLPHYSPENEWYMLQYDLDMALQREQALLADLHNHTISLDTALQREKLHTHQLDVLTERVMQVETLAARDRNELVELEANCTDLMEKLADHEGVVEELEKTCEELKELRVKDQEKLLAWKRKWKEASREAEDLAIRIERHRLLEYEETSHKKKKRGFFAWLFGSVAVAEDDDYEETQDRARSTLLGALRLERKSVAELESSLASMQQNNTAIAEQMQSRDRIIRELNERIAVFEDDKIVLKAALRQLQMEMHEETPKLFQAEKEVERLTKKVKFLKNAHENEIAALNKTLYQKQDKISTTESNLTVIGAYVNKLEERLGDFTVAKREIEKREAACATAERRVSDIQDSKQKLEARVKELEKEHDELKELLRELAVHKSKLQKEKEELNADRETLKVNIESLRQSFAQADNLANAGAEETKMLLNQTTQLQQKLGLATKTIETLENRLNASEALNDELRQKVDGASLSSQEQIRVLSEASKTTAELEQQLAEAKSQHQTVLDEHNEFTEKIHLELEEQRLKAQKASDESQKASEVVRTLTAKVHEKEKEARDATVRLFEMTKRLESRIPQHHSVPQRRTAQPGETAATAGSQSFQRHSVQPAPQGRTPGTGTTANAPNSQRGTSPGSATGSISPNYGRRGEQPVSQNRSPAFQIPERRMEHHKAQQIRPSSSIPGGPRPAKRVHDQRNRQPESKRSWRPFTHNPRKIPQHRPEHERQPKRQFGAGASNVGVKSLVALQDENSLKQKTRSVPLRSLRKFFSRTTGIHGLFSDPSKARKDRHIKNPAVNQNLTAARVIATNSTQLPLGKPTNSTGAQILTNATVTAEPKDAPIRESTNSTTIGVTANTSQIPQKR